MILLVTHEVEFAEQMGHLLEAEGYPVILAFQGSDVLTIVNRENPQLIIVNLYVRNPSGLEVLRQLRGEGYAGKIMMLAGNSVSSDIPQALRLGVDQVLGQPVSFHQILSAVRVAIGLSLQHHDPVTRPSESYGPFANLP